MSTPLKINLVLPQFLLVLLLDLPPIGKEDIIALLFAKQRCTCSAFATAQYDDLLFQSFCFINGS